GLVGERRRLLYRGKLLFQLAQRHLDGGPHLLRRDAVEGDLKVAGEDGVVSGFPGHGASSRKKGLRDKRNLSQQYAKTPEDRPRHPDLREAAHGDERAVLSWSTVGIEQVSGLAVHQ